jgi:hypothetical protein
MRRSSLSSRRFIADGNVAKSLLDKGQQLVAGGRPELLSTEACAQNDESGVRIYAMGADSSVEGA